MGERERESDAQTLTCTQQPAWTFEGTFSYFSLVLFFLLFFEFLLLLLLTFQMT